MYDTFYDVPFDRLFVFSISQLGLNNHKLNFSISQTTIKYHYRLFKSVTETR